MGGRGGPARARGKKGVPEAPGQVAWAGPATPGLGLPGLSLGEGVRTGGQQQGEGRWGRMVDSSRGAPRFRKTRVERSCMGATPLGPGWRVEGGGG